VSTTDVAIVNRPASPYDALNVDGEFTGTALSRSLSRVVMPDALSVWVSS
jgi:hypothetical protein